MRRGIALVAAAAIAALSLAGCSQASSSADSSKPVTISFWNSFTGPDRPGVEGLVKKFNDSQKKIHVDLTIMPGDVLGQKLLPAFQSKTGPTVVGMDPSQVPGFAQKKVIQPIDDIFTSGKLDVSKLTQAQIKATTWNGKHYGVPMSSASAMLYYNKKLLQAAGIAAPADSLEGLAKQAVQLTKYTAGADSKNQYGLVLADHAAVPIWASLIWGWGGGIVSADGKKSEFGSSDTQKAVTFWNDLIQKDHISPVGLSGVDAGTLFSSGRAAFNIEGPWAATGYKQAGVDYGVVPVPAGPKAQASVAVGATLSLNSSITADQRNAALTFMQFWNSKPNQVYWSVTTSYPPNRTDISTSELTANPTAVAFAQKQKERFFPGGVLLNYSQVSDNIFIPAIQKITNNQATVSSVLSDSSSQIDSALK